MQKQTIIVAAIALVIGLGGGYYGAGAMGASAQPTRTGGFTRAGAGGAAGGMRGMMGGNVLSGTVAAKDATSLTIDTRDGSSHVAFISASTTVAKSTAGTLSDVTVGATVFVSGTTNSDGSVSAKSIQLRPADPTQPAK